MQAKWGGRHSDQFSGRLSVRRVRLNQGGYTSTGRYFGVGAPLFIVDSEWGHVEFYIRAADRAAALAIVAGGYPHAKVKK